MREALRRLVDSCLRRRTVDAEIVAEAELRAAIDWELGAAQAFK